MRLSVGTLQNGTYDDDASASGMRTMLHLTARALRIQYTIKGRALLHTTLRRGAADGGVRNPPECILPA